MKYSVTLNVSEISGAAWDAWCETNPVDGIEYNALQDDGLEYWTVTAPSAEMARSLAETAIGDSGAEIVGVVEV